MIEVCLDKEIGTQGWRLAGICAPPAETLFPFWSAPVCDGSDFSRHFHSHVRCDAVVIEASVPVWVHHKYLTLCVPHGNGIWMTPCTTRDADNFAHSFREQACRCETLHATHT